MNLRNRLPFFLAYAQKPRKPIFLEYVEFDGKSYIDTGYYPNGLTTSIYYSFAHNSPDVKGIFGSRQAYGVCTYCAFYVGAKLRVDWVNASATNFSIEKSVKYDLNINNGSISLNDEIVGTYTLKNEQALYPMYLGTVNDNGTPYANALLQKVYGFKIYENNLLIQDLRPALDPRGVVCFYDTVSGQYFYNQGTGTLKAGGRFVESILFDGESYIDTGMSHQTCVIECTIKFTETGTRQLMGFGSSTAQYWGKPANSVILEGVSGTNVTDKTDVVLTFDTDEEGVVKMTRSADGKSVVGTTGKTISTMNYAIGALPFTATTRGYYCTCEVWGNKTYIGGELVQDLRPYVDANGVACFKDVVTDTLFYNKGTGTLTYTEHEELEYLEFDGTKYIDTAFNPSPYTTRVVLDMMLLDDMSSGGQGVFGARPGTLSSADAFNLFYNTSIAPKKFRCDCTGTDNVRSGDIGAGKRLTIDCYNTDVIIDGVKYSSTVDKSGYTYLAQSMYLGNFNNAGKAYTKGCPMKMYGCQIYDNGTLVRDMIPVKRSDGVVCMYDKVENKYYELKE